MKFKNTDPRFGDAGPFEADSRQEIVRGMLTLFKTWAEEAYDNAVDIATRDLGEPAPDHVEFVADEIKRMGEELESALEEMK